MNFSRLFLVLVLTALTGCPATPTCVTVTENRSTHLTLHLSEGCNSSRPATVQTVSFFSRKRNVSLWSIAASDNSSSQTLKLSEITYGVVPTGFSGRPAVKLQAGETVDISISGIGFAEPLVVTVTQ